METYAFGRAKPYIGQAQQLVYILICLMPSPYQKDSLQAMLGLFWGEAVLVSLHYWMFIAGWFPP
jgi:hypothetical protein